MPHSRYPIGCRSTQHFLKLGWCYNSSVDTLSVTVFFRLVATAAYRSC